MSWDGQSDAKPTAFHPDDSGKAERVFVTHWLLDCAALVVDVQPATTDKLFVPSISLVASRTLASDDARH